MELTPVRLARRVFYVDAIQVTDQNMDTVAGWCGGKIGTITTKDSSTRCIKVDVPRAQNDRQRMAFIGDWILSNGAGFKVYQNRALFKDFHRVVEEPVSPSPYDPRKLALRAVRKEEPLGPGMDEVCA